MSAEADFKEREGKERIAAQNDIISLKEAVIGHQKKLNIMTAALSGVVFLFAVFLLIAFRRKKEINTQLEKRVYERTRELESSHHELLRTIGEKERSVDRLAHAVHDSMASIEGLCTTASTETADTSMRLYLRKIVDIAVVLGSDIRQTTNRKFLDSVRAD
jgi:C4-dicarboxylate-specific signal transduction histidine kinase